MTAHYIGSTSAKVTLENKTSTSYHYFEIDGLVYQVEANCMDKPESLKPIVIRRLEVTTMDLGTDLEAALKKDFGL